MERLDVLQINDNNLSAIPPLRSNKMYKHVNLTNNDISDLQGRAHITKGEHIFLIKPQHHEQRANAAPPAQILSNKKPDNGK